jgi:hypothetical protein
MGWSRRDTGVTHYDPGRAYPGYTLFAPNNGEDAYLIDMEGDIVHRWGCPDGIGQGDLLPNGNLLLRTPRSAGSGGFPGVQASGAIQELSWDGEVVWEHRDPNLRRYSRLRHGNTLLLLWEEMSVNTSQQIRGGFVTPNDPERILGDLVVEMTPGGSIVNEWHASDHLDPEQDVICPLENRLSWGGANDLTALDDGRFLISFRVLDTVALVERSSGRFVWKWGRGQISHQHNPTLLANGHVLLLDNGAHRRGLSYSRVVEVDTSTNEIAWEYHGEPLSSFFTHFTGGAQRLPNGNTLICEGYEGRLFEVMPTGAVVWEYISPFFRQDAQGYTNRVFRTQRYDADYAGLAGRDLNPSQYANLNRLYNGR